MKLVINEWSDDSVICLPKQLMKELQLQTNDVMNVKVSGNQIILEKVQEVPELTVNDFFKDYHGKPENVKPIIFERLGDEQW